MSGFLFARWLFFIWISGWLMLPLARRIWREHLPDSGLAIGRVLFLGLATLGAFWLGNLGVPVRASAALLWLVVVALAVVAWKERAPLLDFAIANRRTLLAVETIFFAVFLFFIAMRGYWPDVLWPGNNSGEKPMDMALISACARADSLPPHNPYAAGTRIVSYYYFGHLQAALVSDALFASPRWTYNLMAATIPALCFSALASLCIALTQSLRGGVMAAVLVLTCGTLQPLLQIWKTQSIWPLKYMETSRVIPFTINEYPWFTFSYGDLHAHLFGMPLALLSLCLAWALACRLQKGFAARGWKWTTALASAALGLQILTNTWDFPTYAILLALCLIGAPWPQCEKSIRPSNGSTVGGHPEFGRTFRKKLAPLWKRILVVGAAIMAMGFGALFLASPFLARLHSEAAKPTLLQQPASPAGLWLLIWFVPMAAWLIHLILAARGRRESGAGREWKLAAIFLLVSSIVWLGLYKANGGDFFVLIFLVSLALWTARETVVEKDARAAFLARMALCGFLALLWSETMWAGYLGNGSNPGFTDFKRQDTVFKFGLQAWYLLGAAAACAALQRGETGLVWRRRWHPALRVASLTAICVTLIGSAATTYTRALNFEEWQGLDAFARLAPKQRGIAEWLLDNARDGDFLIEAETAGGGDFSEFSRYSSGTGIPTVVGPASHTYYWGIGWENIGKRKADVRAFYTGKNASGKALTGKQRLRILGLYRVRFVICSDLERKEYGGAAIDQIEKLLPQIAFEAARGGARVSVRRVF